MRPADEIARSQWHRNLNAALGYCEPPALRRRRLTIIPPTMRTIPAAFAQNDAGTALI
ncbi:hypothetical protein CUJ84_pRLN2000443 (plasmid) [Rhizobium leguminosarum]|uniref:Uncharacterized protein n=1 Tax=Rhizobium leguminosarum TaxID=384 RepID=A0A2K9ZG09_RHILE|nr:hypothetical protein CUJ84_pRLN2000443 [Rhizobium leguminosarum]